MRNRTNLRGVLAIAAGLTAGFGGACGGESSISDSESAALRGGKPSQIEGGAGEGGDLDFDEGSDESGEGFVPGEGDDLPPDFCVHGGAVGRIDVTFECDAITIISCKDLSNVVIEFEDGTRQKLDGLSGQSATFSGTGPNAGKTIVGVWVKAGANFSGDGPGYGERFDAPGELACDDAPPGDGDGDGDGDSGDGDGDGDTCGDLDEDCGGEPPPPPACISDPSIPCDPI